LTGKEQPGDHILEAKMNLSSNPSRAAQERVLRNQINQQLTTRGRDLAGGRLDAREENRALAQGLQIPENEIRLGDRRPRPGNCSQRRLRIEKSRPLLEQDFPTRDLAARHLNWEMKNGGDMKAQETSYSDLL
jgi:hypothetical protein